MAYSIYIYYTGEVVVPHRDEVLLCVMKQDFWLYEHEQKRLSNHNMALMLVDILYSRKILNEATYRKIIQKHSYEHQLMKEVAVV